MRIVIIIALLLTAACAKDTPTACQDYASPYMVEYIDGSIVKSDVSQCGQELTAKAQDQSGRAMTATSLTVQLEDLASGVKYLTLFQGQ